MTSDNAASAEDTPSTSDDFVTRGWRNHMNGEHADSEANFRKALEINSQSVEAYYGLAMALKSQDQFQPALKALEKVVALVNADQMKESPVRASMLRNLAITQTTFIQKRMEANS